MSGPLKKRLGQHFLIDQDVIARIVHAIRPRPGQRLIEIGPGDGAMTMPLLMPLAASPPSSWIATCTSRCNAALPRMAN